MAENIERVVLAYTSPGEEMTVSALLERTRAAVIAPMTGISRRELRLALEALEARGQFTRRPFKSMTLWRRA